MLKKIRTTAAIVFFGLITLLFLDFTGTLHRWLSWMAMVQFLPAVLALHVGVIAALVVLTLVFGRIYCSVICPLGVFQDVVAWIHGRSRKGRNRYSYSPAISWLRYLMLAVLVGSIVAGLSSVVALLAPYSSYGRIASNIFQPVYILGNNLLAAAAAHFDSYAFYSREVWLRSLPTFVVAAVTMVVIIVLAWRNGRTYCNTLCPVGTVLGFLSRFSWLKIRIDEQRCISCGLCARNCKASCIDAKSHTIDHSRCVVCGDCIGKCHKKAIIYSAHKPTPANSAEGKKPSAATAKKPTNQHITDQQIDSSRRLFLVGTAMAATATVSAQQKKVDGGLAAIKDKVAPERATPITPPGSLSAQNMARHCTGCQLCVAECPNDVLRPSTSLTKLMQPTSSYERGYCRPECNRCSEVCPTGAIRPISLEDKSSTQIGHAVWIKKNCVPVTDGVECGNCARHCPVGAIMMVELNPTKPSSEPKEGTGAPQEEKRLMVPAVNTERCIGCGACENLCPARPFSAIYVEGHEQHRTV